MQEMEEIKLKLKQTPDQQVSQTDPDARSMKTRGTGVLALPTRSESAPRNGAVSMLPSADAAMTIPAIRDRWSVGTPSCPIYTVMIGSIDMLASNTIIAVRPSRAFTESLGADHHDRRRCKTTNQYAGPSSLRKANRALMTRPGSREEISRGVRTVVIKVDYSRPSVCFYRRAF
jgi:hypothetical protein